VLGKSSYAPALGLTPFKQLIAEHWLWSRVVRRPGGRGIALWWLGRRFPVVLAEYYDLRSFLALERLFPRGRRYLVLLQFIHVPDEAWDAVETRSWPWPQLRRAFERHVIRPVISRSLLRAQVLSRGEQERQQAYFDLPAGTLRLIPWSLATPLRHGPGEAAPQRRGVFASGRAACDWPTVFAAAAGEDWPLTIACGEDDLAEVRRLNPDGRATVMSEIRMALHDNLMRSASVYLLSLKEAQVSSGHLRLATAIQCGTPVVASNVQGLADYLQPGVNALSFEPGNAEQARSKIRQLLDDPELGVAMAQTASAAAESWTTDDYLGALRALVQDACAEATLS
jgi:hypothetical protein